MSIFNDINCTHSATNMMKIYLLRERFIPEKAEILKKWFFFLLNIRAYWLIRKPLGENPEKGGNFEI